MDTTPKLLRNMRDAYGSSLDESAELYSLIAFEKMNCFRKQGQLCDVVIKVEGREFSAHRVVLAASSDYFDAMFFSGMAESAQFEVELKCISPEVMSALLDYVYTGQVQVSMENVQELLPAANLVQLEGVKRACSNFLLTEVDSSNVLGIRRFAELHNCTELEQYTRNYAAHNFESVIEFDEFTCLTYEELLDLIAREDLHIDCEESVYKAVIRWVYHQVQDRAVLLPHLLRNIRLSVMSVRFLTDAVDKDPLIHQSLECRDLVDDAKRFHLRPDLRHEMRERRYRRRDGGDEYLVVIGGFGSDQNPSDSVEMFNPRTSEWNELPDLPISYRYVAACSLDTCVYAIGGFDGRERLNTVCLLDIAHREDGWRWVTPMHYKRGLSAACTNKGLIYVCGGFDGQSRLRSLEVYHPKIDEWRILDEMTTAREGAGLVVVDDTLYCLGGYDGFHLLNSMEAFDLHRGLWSVCKPMYMRRSGAGCALLGDTIYVCGGYGGAEGRGPLHLDTVEAYNTRLAQWTLVTSMNVPRCYVGACPLAGKIYVAAGYNGNRLLDTVESYDPIENIWWLHDGSRMNHERCDTGMCVVRFLPGVSSENGKNAILTNVTPSVTGTIGTLTWRNFVTSTVSTATSVFSSSSSLSSSSSMAANRVPLILPQSLMTGPLSESNPYRVPITSFASRTGGASVEENLVIPDLTPTRPNVCTTVVYSIPLSTNTSSFSVSPSSTVNATFNSVNSSSHPPLLNVCPSGRQLNLSVSMFHNRSMGQPQYQQADLAVSTQALWAAKSSYYCRSKLPPISIPSDLVSGSTERFLPIVSNSSDSASGQTMRRTSCLRLIQTAPEILSADTNVVTSTSVLREANSIEPVDLERSNSSNENSDSQEFIQNLNHGLAGVSEEGESSSKNDISTNSTSVPVLADYSWSSSDSTLYQPTSSRDCSGFTRLLPALHFSASNCCIPTSAQSSLIHPSGTLDDLTSNCSGFSRMDSSLLDVTCSRQSELTTNDKQFSLYNSEQHSCSSFPCIQGKGNYTPEKFRNCLYFNQHQSGILLNEPVGNSADVYGQWFELYSFKPRIHSSKSSNISLKNTNKKFINCSTAQINKVSVVDLGLNIPVAKVRPCLSNNGTGSVDVNPFDELRHVTTLDSTDHRFLYSSSNCESSSRRHRPLIPHSAFIDDPFSRIHNLPFIHRFCDDGNTSHVLDESLSKNLLPSEVNNTDPISNGSSLLTCLSVNENDIGVICETNIELPNNQNYMLTRVTQNLETTSVLPEDSTSNLIDQKDASSNLIFTNLNFSEQSDAQIVTSVANSLAPVAPDIQEDTRSDGEGEEGDNPGPSVTRSPDLDHLNDT